LFFPLASDAEPRPLGGEGLPSRTVVAGFRFTVDCFTNRPDIAERVDFEAERADFEAL
jgi:hypothetical protein